MDIERLYMDNADLRSTLHKVRGDIRHALMNPNMAKKMLSLAIAAIDAAELRSGLLKPVNEKVNTKRSSPPKTASKTEKRQFWSAKKGIARKNLATAKRTHNGGWIEMLRKRVGKYKKHLHEESFDTSADEVLKRLRS